MGITAAFPPAGLLIALGAAAPFLAYSLCGIIKLWNAREAATEKRFEAILDENNKLKLIVEEKNLIHQGGLKHAVQEGREHNSSFSTAGSSPPSYPNSDDEDEGNRDTLMP